MVYPGVGGKGRSDVAKGPIMSERRLPDRGRHSALPVLISTEQDGVCYFDLSRPVKGMDRFEGERVELRARRDLR